MVNGLETLSELLERRMVERQVGVKALNDELGIRNVGKGRALLDRIRRDDMKGVVHHRRELAAALEVPVEEIDVAIKASRARYYKRIDDAWRASFRPHAVLTTTREIPQPIFVAALTGAEKRLYIDPPDDLPEPAWPGYVAARLPPMIPGFGRVTGFVMNYTPDRAVRFDLAGNPMEALEEAYRRGSLWMRGISAAALGLDQ